MENSYALEYIWKMDSNSKPPSRSFKNRSRPSTGKVGARYAQVKPTIDSGKTVRKLEILSNRAASKLKGELFLRISAQAVCDLLLNSTQTFESNNFKSLDFSHISPPHRNMKSVSVRPAIFSMTNPSIVSLLEESEFIIMDMREAGEFFSAHIKNAVNFPVINISRAKFHPHLLNMKNQPNKHIIVYSNDEKLGIEAAQQLALRNYYNVYLLTGGFNEFCKLYPSLVDVQE
jgi:rhodanese-related sulfurtransferase